MSLVVFDNFIENEYLRFLVISLGAVFFVTLTYYFLSSIVIRIAGKKKSYRDFILKKLSRPVLLIVFFIGIYTALVSLSFYEDYYFWVDGVFFVIITLLIAVLISNIISILMLGYLKVRRGFERTPGLLNKALSVIVFIIAIIVILGYFKVDITPMIAGVGLGAVVIGLALQSTLNNFFAGVHILSDKPVGVGDFIELDENTYGTIEDIGWRSTRIRLLTDNLLIIPNGKLAESNIINYSKPKQDFYLWIPCGVAYDSDLEKVEKVTLDVARSIQQTIDGAVKDFEPAFRYKEFGDSNINFLAILRVEEPLKRFIVRNEFIKALKERFDKENIEISWPIRKIYQIR
jgi:small-conductance mechanosensitive channel